MVIQIVVEHNVKSGKEREMLDFLRGLKKKGYGDRADALWSKLLLTDPNGGQQVNNLPADKNEFTVDTWPLLLNGPAKIKLRLSG